MLILIITKIYIMTIQQLEKKSLQELRALLVQVKKVISTKENNEDQAFWADYLFHMHNDTNNI